MPLLEIKPSKRVQIMCSVEESTAVLVDQYAAFLKVPADDVVNSALEYVFSKDKDFQQHRESTPNFVAPETLRVQLSEADAPVTRRKSASVRSSAAN